MKTPAFDSPEWREARDLQLLRWLQGNKDALKFLLTLFNIAEVWDDIIDGDTPDSSEVHRAFMDAMFGLNSNPFYVKHVGHLQPLMLAGINAWLDSTELEKETDTWSQTWAYALRDWYMELVAACAYIVGGFDHMRQISLEARRFFQAETLAEFAGNQPEVWLENSKGQRLHDVTLKTENGSVHARFRTDGTFDLHGAKVGVKVPGLCVKYIEIKHMNCFALYEGDEFRTSWSIV